MDDRINLINFLDGKTVALVGNSLSLFNHNYGQEIDSHDVVIRINSAAMLHTRFDALNTHGKKTTVWGVWDSNTFDREAFKKFKGIKVHIGPKNTSQLVDYTVPRHYYKIFKDYGIENPSSGLMLLYLLTQSNVSKVSVYGFDWKRTVTFTDIGKRNTHHNFDLEEKYCKEKIFVLPNFRHIKMI